MRNVGVTYKLLGVLGISIHPSPLDPGLSPSHLYYKGLFNLTLISVRLCLTFYRLRCLSLPGVKNRTLRILRFWKHQSFRIFWKCILFTFSIQKYYSIKYWNMKMVVIYLVKMFATLTSAYFSCGSSSFIGATASALASPTEV